jgi:Fe2+ transport system protein FeoA
LNHSPDDGEKTMPLSSVSAGRKVKLCAIRAGRSFHARLVSLGLLPGTELEVIHNSAWGPFIVSVKGSRIMLGRGMAEKIEVK